MSSKNTPLKVISASVIGNAMEWYDYLLYAHFTWIISKLFFPLKDDFSSIILTLGVFAAGFLARPLGGYIFGRMGDELGRKKALTISILLMIIPTGLIGFLPTFETIGILAPIVMIIIRILQGISLGGEYSSATTYLVETSPANRKAFFGSFSSMSLALGVLMSSLTVLAIEMIFTKDEILAFAWRIPFIISIFYGLVGLYIRNSLHESEDFANLKKKGKKTNTPFKDIFLNYKVNLILAFGVFMGLTIPFYVIVVFSKSILMNVGFEPKIATFLNCLLIFVYMISVPFFGYLVDKTGERKMLTFGALFMILFAFPFLYAFKSHNFSLIVFANFIAGIIVGMFQSAVPSFCTKMFPTSVRASGVSLSYNLPAIIFGGTAPMIVTYIIQINQGNIIPVGYYIVFGSMCALIASIFSSRTKMYY
jgi:MHS family proline/betaine transporter-like MFS transporter